MNGSLYQAGRLLASWGQCGRGVGTNAADVNTTIPLQNLSQRSTLTCAWLNPSSNESYTLKLPIRSVSGMIDGSSGSEKLRFTVANMLRWYGTGTSPTIQVSVFGWIEDLELITPKFQSEREGMGGRVIPNLTRTVRGFASQFARMAADSALTSVGLGSPPVINSPVMTYENKLSLVKSDMACPAETVAGHQHFEETISPVVSDTDPMDFKNIYSREAWLTRATWTEAMTTGVAAIPVTPGVCDGSVYSHVEANGGRQLLPMGFVAFPFTYWRGDIEFRIEVVSPKLVRGRLKLVYVPYGMTYAFGSDTADVHAVYVDVSESVSASITCNYSHPQPWLLYNIYTPSGSLTPDVETNGTFVIEVVEPLSANGFSVEINVFARATRLEVAVPRKELRGYYLGGKAATVPQAPLALDVYTNIRDIIKLPQSLRTYQFSVDGASQFKLISLAAEPNYPIAVSSLADKALIGEYTAGIMSTGALAPATFLSPLAFYSSAFLMSKGSFRYHFVPVDKFNKQMITKVQLDRFPELGTTRLYNAVDVFPWLHVTGPTVLRDTDANGAVVVEVPTNMRAEFRPARWNNVESVQNRNYLLYFIGDDLYDGGDTSYNSTHMVLMSAGDDYSLDCFQFVPIVFSSVVPVG